MESRLQVFSAENYYYGVSGFVSCALLKNLICTLWQRDNAHVATPGQLNGPMNEEDKKVAYATCHGNLNVNKKTIKGVPSARFGESEFQFQASTTSLGSVDWKEFKEEPP